MLRRTRGQAPVMMHRARSNIDQENAPMRQYRSRAALIALTLAAVASGAAAGPTPWQEQVHPKPSGTSEFLYDVITFGPDSAYAAGYRYAAFGGTIEFRTVVLRWNGFEWSQENTRDIEAAPARNFLRGIGGTSATDLWSVGWYKPVDGGPDKALISHWDGLQWVLMDTPASPPGGAYLYKVAAASPTDAWSVGHIYDLATRENPLALHWDGISWSAVSVPAVPGCINGSQLTDVTMRSTGVAWATGWCNAGGGRQQGYVLRWNGEHWVIVVGAAKLTGDTMLNSVSVAGRGVWAVGDRDFDGARTEPVMLHYDPATGWEEKPVPAELVGRYPSVQAVSGVYANHVWVVGQTDNPFTSSLVDPLTLLWNGESWTRHPAGSAMKMFGVDVTPSGRAWGVGLYQQNDDSLIQMRQGPARPR